MGIIEAKGLTRKFGTRTVVDSLDLDIARGSITGFLGPNGAGKTTTIRMLLGLVHPSAGEATVCGVPITQRQRLKTQVGAMVEAPAFYGPLSALDNLRVLAFTHGLHFPRKQLEGALSRVGLAAYQNQRVQGFSMGMKQRLGVAAALLPDPQVLFLDEPTNGLDPQGQVEMRELLAGLPSEGRTVFVSSHALRDIELVCTDVVVLNRGRKLAQGATKALLAGRAAVRVRVDLPARALTVLVTDRPGWKCSLDETDSLTIQVPATETADAVAATVARLLCEAGIALFEVSHSKDALEHYFLTLTQQVP
jgi:ABC-2 type transport system ATP-binding protein